MAKRNLIRRWTLRAVERFVLLLLGTVLRGVFTHESWPSGYDEEGRRQPLGRGQGGGGARGRDPE